MESADSKLSQMFVADGHINGPIVRKLKIAHPKDKPLIPIYRVLEPDGSVSDESQVPQVNCVQCLSELNYTERSEHNSNLR